MFGGSKLYGNDTSVAVRELVQNAADAIHARQKLEETSIGRPQGEIVIRLGERNGEHWLEVEDNGVGMSQRTMTGALVDFGRSFWGTDAVQSEFPGLMAKGMTPIGKFGIGFFSVFMLGDVVRVTSRRYDSAASDTRTLEFRSGISLRPILRRATRDEAVQGGGTRVAVLLRVPPYNKNGLLSEEGVLGGVEKRDLRTMVATLCPSLDVAVAVELKKRKVRVIKPSDWLRIAGSSLLNRLEPKLRVSKNSTYAQNLRIIGSGKLVYGRACICGDSFRGNGIIAVGGFSATQLEYVEGILLGTIDGLARNTASISVPPLILAQWAQDQADLIANSQLPFSEQLRAAGVVIACGGDPRKLPVARMDTKYLNRLALEKAIRTKSEIKIFHGEPSFEEDADDCHPRVFRDSFSPAPDILFLGEIRGVSYKKFWWPGKPSYRSVLEAILGHHWQGNYTTRVEEEIVGRVDGVEIRREVEVLARCDS
jgi:hypothetical protein